MQTVWINLFQSKTRLMVMLRYFLLLAILFMSIERFRMMLFYLNLPSTFNNRDVMQYYLLAKATISGINPYLPLNDLAQTFIGSIPFSPHPAPCTPFLTIMFIPLSMFSLGQLTMIWFFVELACLVAIASLLPVLWKTKPDWKASIIILCLLLSWYPVVNDLSYGQLSIILTLFLLVGLITLRKNHGIIAGIMIGFTVAIKLITWPLIIYFALKKEWRPLISSCLTAAVLNTIALATIGYRPFLNYYFDVSRQVTVIYQSAMHNLSLWSIGYRLFAGTGSDLFSSFVNAPPLVNLPKIAPFVSIVLIITFLVYSLAWALKSNDQHLTFALLVGAIILISPVSWAHYFVLLIIPLSFLFLDLKKRSFPAWQTSVFVLIGLLLFLFNEQIGNIIIFINGGTSNLEANGNQITFASSLISYVPTIEIIGLTFLLRNSMWDTIKEIKHASTVAI
jgi:hypothetical protein